MWWHFPFTIYLYMSLSLKIIFNKNSLTRFYFDNEFYYYYFLIKYISQYLKNFYIMTAWLPSTWICRWAQFCSYHDCLLHWGVFSRERALAKFCVADSVEEVLFQSPSPWWLLHGNGESLDMSLRGHNHLDVIASALEAR